MNKKALAVMAAIVLIAVVAFLFSWKGTTVSDDRPVAEIPSASPSSTCFLSCQEQPQAAHTGPAGIPVDAAGEADAVAVASKVMDAYTDVKKNKDEWFAALAPYLTIPYAQEAQYIQPSRLPVSKVISTGTVIPAEVPDGHQHRVKFVTNAGEWVVVMTRASKDAPWLASNVLPVKDLK